MAARKKLAPFEERLLAELRETAAHNRAEAATATPAPRKNWISFMKMRYLLVTAAAAAAGLAIGVPAFITDQPAEAHEVIVEDNGTIDVKMNEFKDPDGLERKLTDLGLDVEVAYLSTGEHCGNRSGTVLPMDEMEELNRDEKPVVEVPGAEDEFTIYPDRLLEDEALGLEFSYDPNGWSFGITPAPSPMEECKPVKESTP